MHWAYSTADRLTNARDHSRAICDALARRRADAVRAGDRSAAGCLEARLVVHAVRWRCLSALARAERRRGTAPSL